MNEKNFPYEKKKLSNLLQGRGIITRLVAVLLMVLTVALYSCLLFPDYDSEAEIDPVATVLALLETNHAAEWSKKYTSEAHLPGTNYGLVEWTRDKFEEYGWKATIDTYDVYVSYPESHSLNLLDEDGNLVYSAPLKEDEIEEDSTTIGNHTVPTFLSYAANGNVTAPYVYVNYGTREDFQKLKDLEVDISGKIAIIRYGNIFRGLKVKFAQENGAIGVLLYSDPGDDMGLTPANGFKQYPQGPARQESSVQRGNVRFSGGVGAAPGDPTTPGYPSKGDVERQDPHQSIGRIPVLPISYREVTPILKKLNKHGKKGPKEWTGELKGFDYHVGPNPKAQLNLYSNQTFNITPLWNIYGEIDGTIKDEVIIIGNHRDSWIKGGAGDPNSGSSALIEVARALGNLKKSGYQFKRSILLASFDGEEYGLLGSTEFGEFRSCDLKKNVVAYINVDGAVEGKHFRLGASPLLNRVLRKVASWLPYPNGDGKTLYDHFVDETGDHIKNLGSGSDYTVFLEHLGIPSADIGFKAGKGDGIYHYHSNFDSYHWMNKFGDKGFVFHNLAAKYLALLALELSDHKVIDLSVGEYSRELLSYFSDLQKSIPDEFLNKPIGRHPPIGPHKVMGGAARPDDSNDSALIPLKRVNEPKGPPHHGPHHGPHGPHHGPHGPHHHRNCHEHKPLTIGDLVNQTCQQLHELTVKAIAFDAECDILQKQYLDRKKLNFIKRIWLMVRILKRNHILKYFERIFLHQPGLHGRPWFKHIVFAPGRYTGYAGQTWPGIKEAVEDGDISRLISSLHVASHAVRRATDTLRKSI